MKTHEVHDLHARAEHLADQVQPHRQRLTVILNWAQNARVDSDALASVVLAIKLLGGSALDVTRPSVRDDHGRFTHDWEMLEQTEQVHAELTELADETDEIHGAALQAGMEAEADLADAQGELAEARAMPTFDPCDGCHTERMAAIAQAERKIADANERCELSEATIEALRPLRCFRKASEALEKLPDDLYEVYRAAYTLLAVDDSVMPGDGDYLTGHGAASVARLRRRVKAGAA
jgi:hypothetical protein